MMTGHNYTDSVVDTAAAAVNAGLRRLRLYLLAYMTALLSHNQHNHLHQIFI